MAEEFPGWTPYHYVHNNPISLVDPTGMSAEGTPVKEKQTTGQMIYNHTGFKKSVDWAKSLFTKSKPDEVVRSTEDIGSSVYSKYGGGENDLTTGQQKGERINVDFLVELASGFAGPLKGNKYKEFKDGLELVNTIFSGYRQGESVGESVENTYNDILPYFREVNISGKAENSSTEIKFGAIKVEGTKEEIESKKDSINKANKVKYDQALKEATK